MIDPLPVINAIDLRYRYHDGSEALRGVNIRIENGEKVCLAGPNGAGKSTLLLCLAGLLQAEGRLEIGGSGPPQTVHVASDPSLFGLVFQYPDDQLFCPTVGEDIAFGPRNQKKSEEEVSRQVTQTLSAVGLSGFELRCAHHLSGGEKKRASVAAVMACEPKILALDEPWANLDARASRAMTAIMRDFKGTLLLASHDLFRAAAVCTRLIIIDNGTVVADGPMQALLADASLLDAHGLEL
jgi:energy-coupling factor transporter ATP-binding protein EcfA2